MPERCRPLCEAHIDGVDAPQSPATRLLHRACDRWCATPDRLMGVKGRRAAAARRGARTTSIRPRDAGRFEATESSTQMKPIRRLTVVARSAALLVIAIACTGCLIVPTADDKVLEGTPIPEDRLAFIVAGVTTRSEVVERLGRPSLVWEDQQVCVYRWEMRQAVVAVGAGGAAGAIDVPNHYVLLIRFDTNDRVERFTRTIRPLGESFAPLVRRWMFGAAAEAATGSSPATGREPEESSRKALVMFRVALEIDGRPAAFFSRWSSLGVVMMEHPVGVQLTSFESAGTGREITQLRYISRESLLAGWATAQLAPGTWYLTVVRRTSSDGAIAVVEPRWRLDVPTDAPVLYAGTLRLAFRETREGFIFKEGFLRPVPGVEPILMDEREEASDLARRELAQQAEPRGVLLRRWPVDEPMGFRSPAPLQAP